MEIIIGTTHSDRANNYSSYSDGYRPGAQQDIHLLSVPDGFNATGEEWAEAFYVAHNAPGESASDSPYVKVARDALRAFPARIRTLSKGDTVIVDGVMYACDSAGWTRVVLAD